MTSLVDFYPKVVNNGDQRERTECALFMKSVAQIRPVCSAAACCFGVVQDGFWQLRVHHRGQRQCAAVSGRVPFSDPERYVPVHL